MEKPDPPVDLAMVLIAELLRADLFDAANVASMVRRLNMADLPELADRVALLPVANAFDNPDTIRAAIHIVPSGGNQGD